jgi:hypothetical protein
MEFRLENLLEAVSRLLAAPRQRRDMPTYSRTFRCSCGRHVFFGNSLCIACASPLGYLPDRAVVVPLSPGSAPGLWRVPGDSREFRRCANLDTPAGCNWLLAADDAQALCRACRLNRTIPDLTDADNRRYWGAIEAAKRRLVSQLLALGLPVRSKLTEDPEHGVMFDFLRALPGGAPVTTGHDNGLITINVEEADDVKREQLRHALHEPYRTLLGHFRHEIGHYYWDRLVLNTRWLEPFRELFGDERADYATALKANYDSGPPADWASRHISSYAATHPWEDWAETWAHYLHVVDSLGTALGFGLDADELEAEAEPYTRADLFMPKDPDADRFLALINGWIEMTMVLNELARSMGQLDFYPFVMSRPVVAKVHFVHLVVRDAREQAAG